MLLHGKNGKRKTGLKLLLVVVLIMCGALTYNTNAAKEKEKELQAKKTATQEQIAAGKELQTELKEETAFRQTLQYVEEMARKLMGLVKPDEVILRAEETP